MSSGCCMNWQAWLISCQLSWFRLFWDAGGADYLTQGLRAAGCEEEGSFGWAALTFPCCLNVLKGWIMNYIGSGYRRSRKQHRGYSIVRLLPGKRNIDENRGIEILELAWMPSEEISNNFNEISSLCSGWRGQFFHKIQVNWHFGKHLLNLAQNK